MSKQSSFNAFNALISTFIGVVDPDDLDFFNKAYDKMEKEKDKKNEKTNKT